LIYLQGLKQFLSSLDQDPAIIVGDYNQRIPRKLVPEHVYEELMYTFKKFKIATDGIVQGIERQAIDHLSHSPDLRCREVEGISKETSVGIRLSDHDGVICTI
jgi:hypothetical protein